MNAFQALHSGGPICIGEGGIIRSFTQLQIPQNSQCSAGIQHLMRAYQVGHRKIAQAGFVLKHQAVIFLIDVPVLPMRDQRRTQAGRSAFNHFHRLIGLRADDTWYAALYDACLFSGNFCQRVAQELLMID